MFELLIFFLIGVFLYFGGLEGIIGLLSGMVQLVLFFAYWIPVVVGALVIYLFIMNGIS